MTSTWHPAEEAVERAGMRNSALSEATTYKSIWTPFIGEKLAVAAEEGNERDCHAVAVMKGGHIVHTSHSNAADK